MEKIDLKQVSMFVVAGIFGGLVTLWGVNSTQRSPVGLNPQTVQVQEESATVNTVKEVLPSVVAIVTKQNVRNFFGQTFQAEGGGSGFIVDPTGLIVTNRHVVSSDDTEYTVVTYDGETYDARVVARDSLADLAILKISARDLPVVEFGDSDKLELGQKVIAIGNALGEYSNTVTTGVVSGTGRVIVAGDGSGSSERLEGLIQTDAAINPGNSGGPLLNISGEVIGINTAVDQQGSGIGFAIPINSVKQAISSVIAGGEIVRPRLGVRYVLLSPEFAAANDMEYEEGALVIRGDRSDELAVVPGSPAAIAGIKEGDILISINGEKISEKSSLLSLLQKYKPGDRVEIELISNGEKKKVSVSLGKL